MRYKSTMLYSLSVMTSYGYPNLFLETQWQMMGALESLNGVLLFGLITAFPFAMTRESGRSDLAHGARKLSARWQVVTKCDPAETARTDQIEWSS